MESQPPQISPRPPIVAGFAVLLLLPVLLAAIDIGAGARMGYATRLWLWSVPWLYASAIVLFALWLDHRQTGQRVVFMGRADGLLLASLAVMAFMLSRISAQNPEISDVYLLRFGLAVAMGVAAYYGMRHYQARFSMPIYSALLAGVTLVAPFLFYELYFQRESHAIAEVLVWHMPGFGAVRVFGMALEAGIAVGIGLLVVRRKPGYGAVIFAATVLLWAMLFWSGGRGAILSLLVSTSLASVIYPKYFIRLCLVLALSGATGAALSLLLWTPDSLSFGLLNMFVKTTSGGVEGAIGAGRVEHWQGALALIKQNPLMGYGLGQYSNLWPSYAQADAQAGLAVPFYFLPYRNVHNIGLEVAISWGLVGGAAVMWLILKTWSRALLLVRGAQAPSRLPALLGLNALLFHALVSGAYIFPHVLFYAAIFIGICLAPNTAQNKNTNR